MLCWAQSPCCLVSLPFRPNYVICFFQGSMSNVRVTLALVPCSCWDQGFWSSWSHFNMTFIPMPWRVVWKALTACSSGKRWVTRGFTSTFPEASMAMAIGQLQNRGESEAAGNLTHTHTPSHKVDQIRHHLRVAVAENPSDVHFSCGGIDERKGDHLRTKTHNHHHAARACRLKAKIKNVSSPLPPPDTVASSD